jgi:hypothetical protein
MPAVALAAFLNRLDSYAAAPHVYGRMLLRPEYLSQNLDRPLPTKDGGTLSTIGEACDYMTNMGRQQRRVA